MSYRMTALTTLRSLIEQQGYVLLDGATGTNLFERGLTSGDAPELWNADKPEIIQGLYADWTAAGSNLILTTTRSFSTSAFNTLT